MMLRFLGGRGGGVGKPPFVLLNRSMEVLLSALLGTYDNTEYVNIVRGDIKIIKYFLHPHSFIQMIKYLIIEKSRRYINII